MVSYSFDEDYRWHGRHMLEIEDNKFEIPAHPGQQGYRAVPTLYGLSQGRHLEQVTEEVYENKPGKVQSQILDGIKDLLEDDRLPEKYRYEVKEVIENEFDFFRTESDPSFGVP